MDVPEDKWGPKRTTLRTPHRQVGIRRTGTEYKFHTRLREGEKPHFVYMMEPPV